MPDIPPLLYTFLWYCFAPIRWILTNNVPFSGFSILKYFALCSIMVYVILFLSLLSFNRFKHPFWSRLPAFHLHALMYGWWWFPVGIIPFDYTSKQHTLHSPYSKWYIQDIPNARHSSYHLYSFQQLTQSKSHNTIIHDCITLLSHHFLPTSSSMHFSVSEHSLISTLKHPHARLGLLYGEQFHTTNGVKPLHAMVSFSPLRIRIRHCTNKPWEKIDGMYVDHLCVKRTQRKRGLVPRLTYTTMVNLMKSKETAKYSSLLFRKEGTSSIFDMGILPNVQYPVYQTSFFALHKLFQTTHSPYQLFDILPKTYQVLPMNIQHLIAVLRTIQGRMTNPKTLMVSYEYETIVAQLGKNMWVYGLMDEVSNEPIAVYVWRFSDMWRGDTPSMELVCSLWLGKGTSVDHPLFYSGFRQACACIHQVMNKVELGQREKRENETFQKSSELSSTQEKNENETFQHNIDFWIHDANDNCFIIQQLLLCQHRGVPIFSEISNVSWFWCGLALRPFSKQQVVVLI